MDNGCRADSVGDAPIRKRSRDLVELLRGLWTMVAGPIQCEERPYEQKGSRDLVELLRGLWTMVAEPIQCEARPYEKGPEIR